MPMKPDVFERSLANFISTCDRLPDQIPTWLTALGVVAGARIIRADGLGSSGAKTDVIVYLEQSEPIKISAKLISADYYGNWYSHGRIIEEFGVSVFQSLTLDCTRWANDWKNHPNASLFVGVSVNFGKRTGNTGVEFTDVFAYDDIKTIVAGHGSGDGIANCLYSSDDIPVSIDDLINKIRPIDNHTIKQLSQNFKVIYRPINPETEGTNRGKCTYTQFVPYQRHPTLLTVRTLAELNGLGTYQIVQHGKLNHNHILTDLEQRFNIKINRKI